MSFSLSMTLIPITLHEINPATNLKFCRTLSRTMNKDRRTNFRIPLKLPARYDGMSGAHEARIEDLSLGGCFINSRGQVEPGEAITVEIKLPSGQWLKLRGEVTAYHPGIGFGMVFSSLTTGEERALQQLIIG